MPPFGHGGAAGGFRIFGGGLGAGPGMRQLFELTGAAAPPLAPPAGVAVCLAWAAWTTCT